jgi:hypothetical protein
MLTNMLTGEFKKQKDRKMRDALLKINKQDTATLYDEITGVEDLTGG